MTIRDIIRNGKGRTHGWVVTEYKWNNDESSPWTYHSLYHHGTRMATWKVNDDNGLTEIVSLSLGWGSVSDQNGMNTLFRELGAPYRFNRAGGASIVNYDTGTDIEAPFRWGRDIR